MYKVLLTDDEGIARDSLTFLLNKNFEGSCDIRTASSGREAIELAEAFRPDVIVMDIQMPGIGGIEAIREIRKFLPGAIFMILTAYGQFDYAKNAIDLGVSSYLTKPLDKDIFIEAMANAFRDIDKDRQKRSRDLQTWEKLETVIPIIESGLIYSMLLDENSDADRQQYCNLLDIKQNYGFMILIECGDEVESGQLDNAIGSGIKIQKYYKKIREILKQFSSKSVVGPIMMNKIPVLVPHAEPTTDYNERIHTIDSMRTMISQLEQRADTSFRIGIGSLQPMSEMHISYQEALRSLINSDEPISHADDLPVACEYEDDYPKDTENDIFDNCKRGDAEKAAAAADQYFSWMEENQSADHENNIRLKALEFVLWAEHIAYENGSKGVYRFTDRGDYMQISYSTPLPALHKWFVEKIKSAAEAISDKSKLHGDQIVDKAKEFIDTHFDIDISLDDVSREMDISPYYFSKLFKEKAGVTFIEYLTTLRINKAKEFLSDPEMTIKTVCAKVGFQDPNYFGRLFKRYENMTPSDYQKMVIG